jgi:predicted glycoside hydrolase/deacetylase ChbG (UPF0249 family)
MGSAFDSSNPVLLRAGSSNIITETTHMTEHRTSHRTSNPQQRRASRRQSSRQEMVVMKRKSKRRTWQNIVASTKTYAGFLSHFKHEAATEARLVQQSIKAVLQNGEKDTFFLVRQHYLHIPVP